MLGDRLGSTDVHLACNESVLAGLVTVEKIIEMGTIDRKRKIDMRLQVCFLSFLMLHFCFVVSLVKSLIY